MWYIYSPLRLIQERARQDKAQGTSYNFVYGEAPPEGALFSGIYERVGISLVEVYEMKG